MWIDGNAIVMIKPNLPDSSGYMIIKTNMIKIIKDAQKVSWMGSKNLDLKNPNNLHNKIKSAGSYAGANLTAQN